jgi:RecA-family ATPase
MSHPFDVVRLPKPLQDYLDYKSEEGNRNERLMAAACQARDCRWSQPDTESRLLPLAIDRDGLPMREARATINSAYTKPARDVPHGTRPGELPKGKFVSASRPSKPKLKEAISKEVVIDPKFVLPEEIPNGAVELLRVMFKSGEWIMIASGEYVPEEDRETVSRTLQETWERDALIKQIELYEGKVNRFFEHEFDDGVERGVFFCINPLKAQHCRRITENVAEFRHILLEFDEKEVGKDESGKPITERIPLETQLQSFIQSEAPITAVSFSGGKSLHAYPKSNARDVTEHRERAAEYMDFFGGKAAGIDEATKDAVRFSRLPGAYRSDSKEKSKLISLALGEHSYEAWRNKLAVSSDQLPKRMVFSGLLKFDPASDPNALIGENRFLCKGMSMILAGPSGIGKSSFAMQMVICWCIGRDFFGIKAKRPLKILLIQAENDYGDMSEAAHGIAAGMGLTDDELALLEKNLDIRHDYTHTSDAFLKVLSEIVSEGKHDVALCDPLYTYVGGDLVKPEVIANFCTNGINPIAQTTGVVVIFMHHVPKPPTDTANKRKGRDMAYAGAGHANLTNWTRAYANLEPDQADLFRFSLSKREKRSGLVDDDGKLTNSILVQHAPKGIYWMRADLTGLPAVEPEKKAGRPPTTFTPTPDKLEVIKKAMEKFPDGISGRNLKSLLATLRLGIREGHAVKMGATKCYSEIMPVLENEGYLQKGKKGLIFVDKPTDSTNDSTDSTIQIPESL